MYPSQSLSISFVVEARTILPSLDAGNLEKLVILDL